MAKFFQSRQDRLQFIPLQAEADLFRMIRLPAPQQSLQDVGAIKCQVGDVLLGVPGTEHPVGDAPGQDHIIAVQMVQDLRIAEAVDNVDMDLIRLHIADQALYIFQLIR